MPKKFIALIDVELNDEYSLGIDDIFLGIYTADSKEDALTKVKADWDNGRSWAVQSLGTECYDIKVKEVSE